MPEHSPTTPRARRARRTPRIRALAALAATSAAALLLASCSASSDAATPATATVIEAVPSLPTSFAYDDGDFTYAGFEFQVNTNAQLIRNPYVENADGDLQQDYFSFEGELAESYDVSDDGLTYTFHLREGVLSQAGNELTADDVLWSYERKWNTASVAPLLSSPAIVDPARQFSKIDDYTVQITVDRAGDGFTLLALLANVSADIFDSTLLKEHESADDPYAVAWSAENGNYGFGAYMLESMTPGEELVLVANPNYYDGEPEVKKVIQRVVADAGTRTNLVRNDDVQVAVQLRPADLVELEESGAAQTFLADSINYSTAILNTTSGPFADEAVRTAFRYAMPYEQIIEEVYKGRAEAMTGFINPNYPGGTLEGLEPGSYQPEKAKEVLEAAGYTEPVPITILTSNGVPDAQEVAVQIQTYAADAGFDVSIDAVPVATANEKYYSKNFDAYIQRDQAISQSPPYELLLSYTKDSPLNNSGWTSDEYYAAVAEGVEAGDALSEAAGVAWNKAQQIWQAASPAVPIAFIEPSPAFSNTITGYANRSDAVIDFSNVTFVE
ncbi:ABC transporter substrate-binding protein [Herbiconiux moechotypicola]|uniref:ABC transporter substrate-binding protein n=1 Tax=Herbiconiux moechotypicola TaxID=637393 RepID=A0ABP5QFX5_9MICO|nr:ABC transporter substrate-binding protein [Herbiconiux moechotypicola]MCS5730051.1 ABC transporter substrate-binding protein [Herbiconiux moechotypicola]